jgi:hypothetical protein
MRSIAVVQKVTIAAGHAFPRLVPDKPKRMSEKKYRELHDFSPVVIDVTDPVMQITACGLVSASVIAKGYHQQGRAVEIYDA